MSLIAKAWIRKAGNAIQNATIQVMLLLFHGLQKQIVHQEREYVFYWCVLQPTMWREVLLLPFWVLTILRNKRGTGIVCEAAGAGLVQLGAPPRGGTDRS